MAKDSTFYFTHDYNSRADEKVKLLLMRWGMAGYGVYWAVIEDLYQNGNSMRVNAERIAYDLRVGADMVASILHDFELFVFEGDTFGSLSVQRRMDERATKSATARSSAQKRWGEMRTQCERNANASKSDANAMHTNQGGNAIKERKGKEKKEKERKNPEQAQAPAGGGAPDPDFIKAYTDFMTERQLPSRITPADAAALKAITAYLRKVDTVQAGSKTALELWQFILTNWHHLSAWQQAQLQPRQINAQLPNIIETIKQAYNGKKPSPNGHNSAASLAQAIRAGLAASE